MILFLDFDGVLHPLDARAGPQFCRRPLLEAMLLADSCAGTGIVISSAWRKLYSLRQLRLMFSPALQRRILGCTPVIEDDGPYLRGREIRAWLCAHALEDPWLALDDDRDNFAGPDHGRVVFTDPAIGLSPLDAARLGRLLRRTK